MHSPFHHPELLKNYTERARLSMQFPNINPTNDTASDATYNEARQSDVCFPELYLFDNLKYYDTNTTLQCSKSNSCVQCTNRHSSTNIKAYCVTRFHTSEDIIVIANSPYIAIHEHSFTYLCNLIGSLYSNCTCLIVGKSFSCEIRTNDTILNHSHKQLKEVFGVKSQSWHITMDKRIYSVAVNDCVSQQDTFGCHWIPHSVVTGKLCEDCPPICRSVHHIITFAQFCVGAVLLKISLPTGRVSAVNLISDVVDKEYMVNSCNQSLILL